MPLAAISLHQVLVLIVLFVVVNVVLLLPVVLSFVGVWREHVENEEIRRGRL